MLQPESPVIVAPATPWGLGALAILRLSGHRLLDVLQGFVRPHTPGAIPDGRPRRVDLFDGDGVFDDGVLLWARADRSLTGEPSAELTVHGNPLVVERAVQAALGAGARLAAPGAFTRRAVLAGKLDLVQAEAVLQIAQAQSAAGLQIARAGLDGRLSTRFAAEREALLGIAAELEASIDHPEAALEQNSDGEISDSLEVVAARCRRVASGHGAGRTLLHGARVALVGPVNAGKSSLFNALVGERRALVHEREGTTRDVIEARVVIDGLPLTLLDTAGERVADDPVEQAGIELGRERVESADAVLVVLRARPEGLSEVEQELLDRVQDRPHLVIYNGVDREGHAPAPAGSLPTVAPAGEGVAQIVPRLREVLALREPTEAEPLIASVRQRDLLLTLAQLAEQAVEALRLAGPVVAAELVIEAVECLDELTGAASREAVLDALFARFCIGK